MVWWCYILCTLTHPNNVSQHLISDKEKEAEKSSNKKDGLGAFYNLPHYMKLYEVLKGAYSNYKVGFWHKR